jgi:hypothetical protein
VWRKLGLVAGLAPVVPFGDAFRLSRRSCQDASLRSARAVTFAGNKRMPFEESKGTRFHSLTYKAVSVIRLPTPPNDRA